MVYLEVQPGTVIVSANYLHSVENRSAIDHEKWIDAEVRALTAEEEVKDSWQRIADAQLRAEAERVAIEQRETQNDRTDLEVMWRRRFLMLCAAVLVIGWLVMGLVVVPHWPEITEWFR